MNNKTITDIFFSAIGKKRAEGREDTLTALIPFFMMDECFQLYYKYISKVSCCYNQRRILGKWRNNYNNFSRAFTCNYNSDQKDYIFEKMDNFESYIYEDMEKVIEVVKRGLDANGVKFEYQHVLSICMICNILTQTAQIMWGNTYRNSRGESEVNRDLLGVERATMEFANAYYPVTDKIDLNEFEDVTEQIDRLCHKMIDWLAEDVKMESRRKPSILSWESWKHRHKGQPMPSSNIGVKIHETLVQYGYDLFDEVRGHDLFKERRPKEVVEDRLEEESDNYRYEYVFVGKRSKTEGREDVMAIYRKKREGEL